MNVEIASMFQRANPARVLGARRRVGWILGSAGVPEDAPTAREQGIDLVFVNWRGFYMPPDVPPDAVKFWEKTIGKMVKSKPWGKTLDEMHWRPFFLTGHRLRKFLDEDLLLTQRVLQELRFLR